MSQAFQSTLKGSSVEKPKHTLTFLDKFIELNAEMYRSNQRLTADHPYGSKWYTWPFMKRGIFYWVNGTERIYLLGNPIIWWASTVAILVLLFTTIMEPRHANLAGVAILLGYVINLLPFIGIQRVMFLYHYFTGFIFAVLALVYLLDQEKKSATYFKVLLLLAFVAFVYFAPLSYGLPLTESQFNNRVWLPGWR